MERFAALCTALAQNEVPWRGDERLAEHCTFQIGGPAAVFVEPRSEEELCKAISLCGEYGVRHFLLGNGSNVLFADAGFDGAVIATSAALDRIAIKEDGRIEAGGGVQLARVCRVACEAGLAGMEFAYGIPGTVGGAVYMNAGAYGGEMRDILCSVRVLTESGTIEERAVEQLCLAYRYSALQKSGECVLGATFQLRPGVTAQIAAAMEDCMRRRREKQPLDKPSAGSTFKRPAGAFAAALIDQCGLRGLRVGGAAVSEKHCGFVVNLGGATCADVLALCEQICAVVEEKTGYRLEREIRVIS